jgi:hypothetical protein
MKFYGIDAEGKLQIPSVSTLPTYDYTTHKGLLYYQTSDDTVYLGVGDAAGDWILFVSSDTSLLNSISKELIDAKGDILVATDGDIVGKLTVGSNGQVLMADSAEDTGMKWATLSEFIAEAVVDAKGDLIAATSADVVTALSIGINSQVLMVDSTEATGMKWATISEFIATAIVNAKGDILAATSADAVGVLPVGTNNQVLTADSSKTTGMKWATLDDSFLVVDTKGDIIVAIADNSVDNLPVGTNNQVLTVDSSETTGVKWATPSTPDASAFTHTQSTPSTTWSITHALGIQYVSVTCSDTSNLQILPTSVEFVGSNNLIVTFATAMAGTASINGGTASINVYSEATLDASAFTHTQSIAQTTWSINHALGIQYVGVTCSNTSDLQILPTSVEFVDENNLTVTFATVMAGTASINGGVSVGKSELKKYSVL